MQFSIQRNREILVLHENCSILSFTGCSIVLFRRITHNNDDPSRLTDTKAE